MSANSICALLIIAILGPARVAAEDVPQAQDLIKAYKDATTFSKVRPYEITAAIEINPGSPSAQSGRITIYREEQRSRVELQFAKYHDVKVRLGDKLYVFRSTGYPAPGLQVVQRIIDGTRVADFESTKFSSAKSKKVDGQPAYCVQIKSKDYFGSTDCFDAQTKLLLRSTNNFEETRFFEYHTFEQVQFPSHIEVLKQGRKVLEIKDIDVRKFQAAPETFAIPENSREFATCDKPQVPTPIKTPDPDFPGEAAAMYKKGIREETRVYAYGIVQKDGSFTDIKVLYAESAPFEQAVIQRLQKWKFKPATCGGNPIAFETQVEVKFERD